MIRGMGHAGHVPLMLRGYKSFHQVEGSFTSPTHIPARVIPTFLIVLPQLQAAFIDETGGAKSMHLLIDAHALQNSEVWAGERGGRGSGSTATQMIMLMRGAQKGHTHSMYPLR